MGVASICAVTCVLKGCGFKPRRRCSKSTAALAAKVTVKSQQGWFSHQEMISRWKGNTNDAPQKQKPEGGHHTEIGGRARGTFDGNHLASPEPCAAIEFDPAQRTQDRIFAAARKLDYRPNPVARALRTKRSTMHANYTDAADNGSRALVFAGAKEFARAVHAIRQAGLRIPGDVSVVGF